MLSSFTIGVSFIKVIFVAIATYDVYVFIDHRSNKILEYIIQTVCTKLMRIVLSNRECYFLRHFPNPRLLANVQIDRYMVVIVNVETRIKYY